MNNLLIYSKNKYLLIDINYPNIINELNIDCPALNDIIPVHMCFNQKGVFVVDKNNMVYGFRLKGSKPEWLGNTTVVNIFEFDIIGPTCMGRIVGYDADNKIIRETWLLSKNGNGRVDYAETIYGCNNINDYIVFPNAPYFVFVKGDDKELLVDSVIESDLCGIEYEIYFVKNNVIYKLLKQNSPSHELIIYVSKKYAIIKNKHLLQAKKIHDLTKYDAILFKLIDKFSICYINKDEEVIIDEIYMSANKNYGIVQNVREISTVGNDIILCAVNSIHVIRNYKNLDDSMLEQIDYPFDISFVGNIKLRDFNWTPNTHNKLSNLKKLQIKTFLLCNRLMKQYKIPYWVLYIVFNFIYK